jgi:hypothetical protein
MHKTFYASGFLYNVHTQQILLQQQTDNSPLQWSLFGKKSQNTEEDPARIFRDAIYEQLHIKLPTDAIYAVYNYVDEKTGELCYTFYAEVNLKDREDYKRKGYNMEWFNLKQITKLSLSRQTKHDIVVADRVIKQKARAIEEALNPTEPVVR